MTTMTAKTMTAKIAAATAAAAAAAVASVKNARIAAMYSLNTEDLAENVFLIKEAVERAKIAAATAAAAAHAAEEAIETMPASYFDAEAQKSAAYEGFPVFDGEYVE